MDSGADERCSIACRLQKSLVNASGRSYSRTGSARHTLAVLTGLKPCSPNSGTRYRSMMREREVFSMTVTAARPMRSAPIIQTLPLYRTGPA
jgi:hypothetical protein